jgi:uncharacterized RDD family membrane protein YckC
MHRAISALLDGSMVVLGFGLFLAIFLGFAGSFAFTRQTLAMLAVSFALIGMFYGLVWALAGRETAGMHWTELRLINFNGFALDGKARALRLVGCWLSLGSGMIGNLWAMVDEESLTWHDHMSKTFPTPRDAGTPFFRPRD